MSRKRRPNHEGRARRDDVVEGEHESDRQNDGGGKFENGRRNGVFIGGVGGGAVSQRGATYQSARERNK
ncbi:hypothetical protein BHE90_008511 [Fusarium euwallaceae]|uniref:Uncharacterized protein n=5 Tax=Fusarium solani species complex TaxID=232080 RepID=A0A3M2RXH2_9HYPO|nr:hypothetical protein CDV36_010366 [Fusarium kuroshium]RSL77967.1 hypothetical protein CEP51_008618 [Fusarium floridanum]RSM15992.1 hypothetical protein CEP52_000487 [Fusarium oligoseptatum]RSM18002.1 hypothetical protein CDV31_003100 [Fusarium ambrosium]RTE77014.1 hypothetical protein BHE90_008511 [Fusarium euwallaceae]